MIANKKILAVVPARGGSKGIPLKNLRQIGGKSLVSRVGDVIRQVPAIDRSVVSTDNEQIAGEAERAGISAPFRRNRKLSGDRICDHDVLVDALVTMEVFDSCRYDIILMLQPTSPFRTGKQIMDCLEMLSDGAWDAVWTVSLTDTKAHPLKQLKLSEKCSLGYYDPDGAQIIARQQLEPVFHRNGVAYAFTRDCLLNQNTILGKRTGALIIDEYCVNIDTHFDLDFAEYLIKSGKFDA